MAGGDQLLKQGEFNMHARVKTKFDGCRDGNPLVETFKPGDQIEGDLAEVAVREKWASEVRPKSKSKKAEKPAVDLPVDPGGSEPELV
jgi:hypothetical protein